MPDILSSIYDIKSNIFFIAEYGKAGNIDKLDFEAVSAHLEQRCHSEPVLTLVWESPSNSR